MPDPARLAALAAAVQLGAPDCLWPPLPPSADCAADYFDDRLQSAHFDVQWEDGSLLPGEPEALIDALEQAWAAEITAQGWAEPAGTGELLLPVLVLRGEAAGGSTTTEPCPSLGIDRPVIAISSGSFARAPGYVEALAAHELNHASQLAYGQAHERWLWEATATYMEALARPELDPWRARVPAWAESPSLGMNAWDRSGDHPEITDRAYGLAVFLHHLSAAEGGPLRVRGLWEQARGRPGQHDLWLPDALSDAGLDPDAALLDFAAAAARDAVPLVQGELGLRAEATISALPAGGSLDAPPQSLGLTVIEINDLHANDAPYLHLRVEPTGPAPDRWIGALVTEAALVPLDRDAQGRGRAALPIGDAVRAWVVLMPIDAEAQGPAYPWATVEGFTLTWTLEGRDEAEPLPWPDDAIADANDAKGGGCASAPIAAPPTLIGLSLWAAALGRRPRRRSAR